MGFASPVLQFHCHCKVVDAFVATGARAIRYTANKIDVKLLCYFSFLVIKFLRRIVAQWLATNATNQSFCDNVAINLSRYFRMKRHNIIVVAALMNIIASSYDYGRFVSEGVTREATMNTIRSGGMMTFGGNHPYRDIYLRKNTLPEPITWKSKVFCDPSSRGVMKRYFPNQQSGTDRKYGLIGEIDRGDVYGTYEIQTDFAQANGNVAVEKEDDGFYRKRVRVHDEPTFQVQKDALFVS